MTGRGVSQRGTPVGKSRTGVATRGSEQRVAEYGLHINRVMELEVEVENNSKRWKELDGEMKEIKHMLEDWKSKNGEEGKGSEHMLQTIEGMRKEISELNKESLI